MHCRQISKKHQIRLDTPWLDPSKTLAEQEVMESDELILMYRFYYHMQLQRYTHAQQVPHYGHVCLNLSSLFRESANVEMLYKQAR